MNGGLAYNATGPSMMSDARLPLTFRSRVDIPSSRTTIPDS